MFTRKFYDITIPDAPSIASIMAQKGSLNATERGGEIPKVDTSELAKPEPPAAEPAKANPANQSEPAKAETKPKEEPKGAPAQTEPAPTTAPQWQEVLKQQQPNLILKELGYGDSLAEFLADNKDLDPKVLGFLKHWKAEGNVESYLKAMTTDFSKMSPEEVMRRQLQEQYPEMDAKQLETLYKIKVQQRYKLDSTLYSEEEVEEGRIELMADSKPIREALAQKQQDYLLPKPVKNEAAPDPRVLQQQQELEAYKTQLNENSFIKNIVASKQLTIGEGDDAYNHPVDPNKVLGILNDKDEWASSYFTVKELPNGEKQYVPDFKKQAVVGAILADMDGFFTGYAKHLKALGAKTAIAPIENAKLPGDSGPAKSETESKDPAAVMAKRGVLNRGGSN